MKAAVLETRTTAAGAHLRVMEVARPELSPGHLLLRVLACGVCRTDLHIAEGDLPALRQDLIPGHQIVGEIVEGASETLPEAIRFATWNR